MGTCDRFGKPSPTQVAEGTQAGPGILITGHDMVDLDDLLDQCKGTDVKVYTHGEMLPAHMYPALREHPNLAGHFGGAWQKQRREFAAFPGPVVATTNCVLIPRRRPTRTASSPRVRPPSLAATRSWIDDFSRRHRQGQDLRTAAPPAAIKTVDRRLPSHGHPRHRPDHRGGGEGRQDQPLLRHRRLRRRRTRAQLLQRLRQD